MFVRIKNTSNMAGWFYDPPNFVTSRRVYCQFPVGCLTTAVDRYSE